jgi:hypothetical protein
MYDEVKITNREEALAALKEHGVDVIKEVPQEFISAEFVEGCIKEGEKNGYAFTLLLEYAPPALLPSNLARLCLEAVKIDRENGKLKSFDGFKDGGLGESPLLEAVKLIPENLWTGELTEFCLEMIRKHGGNIRNVPKQHLTAQMCEEATKSDPANKYIFEYIPDIFKTEAMCIAAVKADFSTMIGLVPEKFTPAEITEMCIEEIKKKADRIGKIPERFITAEVGLEVVKREPKMYSKIPENVRTSEIYFEAIKDNPAVFTKMPDNLKTSEMCLLMAEKLTGALDYVPENLVTEAMCLIAVKQCFGEFERVPEKFKTDAVIAAAKEGGYIFPAKQVTAAELSAGGMDMYMKMMQEQMQNLPPEAREAMMAAMKQNAPGVNMPTFN